MSDDQTAVRDGSGDPEEPDDPDERGPPSATDPGGKRLALLSLAALGVVYGDIGTSPLYAIRESFHEGYGLPVEPVLLIRTPPATENPFYRMGPDWALYPMVVIALVARAL